MKVQVSNTNARHVVTYGYIDKIQVLKTIISFLGLPELFLKVI